MKDVYIFIIPLPGTVRGVTVLENDDYIIYINEFLCSGERQKTIEHELMHIEHNHLYDCRCKKVISLEMETEKALLKHNTERELLLQR